MGKIKRYLTGLFCLACMFAFTSSEQVMGKASSMNLFKGGYRVIWQTTNYNTYSPAIAYDSLHDEYLVVWENIQIGGAHDVYARRVSGNGQILTWFAVSAGPHNRMNPSVAYDPTHDRFLVTWGYDYTGDGSDIDVYGRYISWNGGEILPEFFIADSTASEGKPEVAYGLANDEFLVVWKESSAGSPSSIKGAYLLNNGTFLRVTISSGVEDRDFPDVAYNLARNEYMVTWDVVKSVTGVDIYALRLDDEGNVLTNEFAVANTNLIEQHPTVSACRQADQYLVVWEQQFGTASDYDLWGRFMNGNLSYSHTTIIEDKTVPEQNPDLTCNWAGTEYFLAWHVQYVDPFLRWGVWARQIGTNFAMENSFEVVAPSDTADRRFPAVAGGKSSYLAAWEHQRDGNSYRDIWGQIYYPHLIFLSMMRK